jgi:hypothetical protein
MTMRSAARYNVATSAEAALTHKATRSRNQWSMVLSNEEGPPTSARRMIRAATMGMKVRKPSCPAPDVRIFETSEAGERLPARESIITARIHGLTGGASAGASIAHFPVPACAGDLW